MAIKVWRGDAQGVAQVDNVTVENVEVGDIFTLTINRKAVSYTATADTPASVYDGLAAAITAAAIPEFPSATSVAATTGTNATDAYLKLTGAADGTPYTVTGSTSNGGTASVAVDVAQSGGGGVNMIQRVSLPSGLTGGTFTLSFEGQETTNLTYDESAADIESALKALSNIGASDVSVSGDAGGPWLVEFEGTLAAATQTLLSGDGSSLAGQSVTVTTTANGQPGDNHQLTITGTQLLSETDPVGFYLFPNEPDAIAAGTIRSNQTDAQWLGLLRDVYGLSSSSSLSMTRTTTTTTSTRTYTIEVEIIAEKAGQAVLAPTVTRSTVAGTDQDATVNSTLVSAGGNSTNETQVVTLPGNPTGGTFTLTFQGQTTSGIAYNASTSAVGSALEALSNIGSGDVSVTGEAGNWTIEFVSAMAATDYAQMTGSGSSLTGGTVAVSTTQAAVPNANEQVLISLSDNVTGGTFTLTYDSSESANIDYDATAAGIETALEGTSSIGSGDVAVSGPAGGPWLIEFTGSLAGTDVTAVTGDGTNLTGAETQGITVTSSTSPTGPYHWDNANNWDASGVPTDSDTVVFENNDNAVKYGLDQSAVTLTQLEIRSTYTGTIGLPDQNPLGYIEYLDTHLQIGATTVLIGEGEGGGSERVRLDLGSVASAVYIYGTGTPANAGDYAVDLVGTNTANDLYVYQGSVSVGKNSGDTSVIDDLLVGYDDDQASDVELFLGDDVTLDDVTVHGGTVINGGRASSAITSLLVTAGTVTLNGTDGLNQLDIEGGTVFYRSSGTLGGNTVVGGEGTLSFVGDLRAKTVTNAITCRGDAANVDDPQESVSSLVVAYQSTTRLPELGTNFTVTRS